MDVPLYKREHGLVQNLAGSQAYASSSPHDIFAVKQKLGETTLLLEVLAEVNSLMGMGNTFELFCAKVGKILKERLRFKYIHIWVRDENNETVLKLVTPESISGFRTTSIYKGLVGKAFCQGRIVCAPDVGRDPDYSNVHLETKSELCIPLRSQETVIGVINIESEVRQDFEAVLPVLSAIAENLSHSMKIALLHETEEKFHDLVEQMSEGVCVSNKEDTIVYINRAFQSIMGFSQIELVRHQLIEYAQPESTEEFKNNYEKAKHGVRSHFETVFIGKNGEKIPTLINLVPSGNEHIMATVTDLRAIKSTENKLRQTERFLASITQHCQEAIVGLDDHGVIHSWNVGAERMFGYRAHEVIGKSTHIIIPEELIASKESEAIIQEARTKGFVKNFETTRVHKNGKPIQIALTMSAVRHDRNLVGLSALYRDISPQKKWEREIQDRFEKMQDAYREMGKQRRYLDYLMELISMASSPHISTKQIASFIVNAMVMITRVDAATMRLLDAPHDRLVLIAQSGVGEDWWSKKYIPYHESLVEMAVKNGHPLKILDIIGNPHYSSPSLARKNNLRSALILPLEVKGEVLGSLNLYLSHEGNLSLLDDEFIGTFAKQAAIGLKLVH